MHEKPQKTRGGFNILLQKKKCEYFDTNCVALIDEDRDQGDCLPQHPELSTSD